MKTIDERKAILDAEVIKWQRKGWQVLNRTDFNCQLRKKKDIDGCLALFLFLLAIIPGIIYLVVASGKENTLFVEVSENGFLKYESPNLSKWELSRMNKKANSYLY
jgi:hypothetical protein